MLFLIKNMVLCFETKNGANMLKKIGDWFKKQNFLVWLLIPLMLVLTGLKLFLKYLVEKSNEDLKKTKKEVEKLEKDKKVIDQEVEELKKASEKHEDASKTLHEEADIAKHTSEQKTSQKPDLDENWHKGKK